MAKIVQSLTQPPKEYDQITFLSLVRDLNGLIEKLNTKGKKIMKSMKKQYGKKRGEQVFYASLNKKKIKGVKKT